MEKNFLVVGIVLVLLYCVAFFTTCETFMKIRESYLPYEQGPGWLKLCGPFCVYDELLRRKNNGDDPYKETKSISYVNYIADMDFFD